MEQTEGAIRQADVVSSPANESVHFERLREFVQATEDKRRAERMQKTADKRLAELAPQVLKWFEQNGVKRVTVMGFTLFQRRELWAGVSPDSTTEAAVAALRELSEDWAVYAKESINVQGLSARIRELDEEADKKAREDGSALAGEGATEADKAAAANTAELSALVSRDPVELLPEELRGVIGIREVYKVSARRETE